MKTMTTLSREDVYNTASYNPRTGEFIGAKSHWLKTLGKVIGTATLNGYTAVSVCGVRSYAHRLAWFYMKGKWPEGQIDHINGVRNDNRWCNLREVTNAVNAQNKRTSRRNDGIMGVYWHRRAKKWAAQIVVDGKNHYLGLHLTQDAAHSAYISAKREFHVGCTI